MCILYHKDLSILGTFSLFERIKKAAHRTAFTQIAVSF